MPTERDLEQRTPPAEIVEGSPLHRLLQDTRQNQPSKAVPDSRDWWMEVAEGLGVKTFTLGQQREELISALRSLRNEAHAMLSVADPQVNGLSNIRALAKRIKEADHVLAHADAV